MTVQLSAQDWRDLKSKGFSENDINKAITEIEQEDLQSSFNQQQQRRGIDPRMNAQHSAFASKPSDDMAKWQIELNDILERAEHILRGDIVVFKDGQLIWEKNPEPEKNPLNENGVQAIIKLLSMYINRNTILSDYTQTEINYKVLDFGKRLNDFVFMKYEEIGLDTEDKRKEYPTLVGELVDLVHSAYKRALEGGERRSLREMINISQSNAMGQQGMMMPVNGMPNRSRGILNPMRYIKGKYI